MSQWVMIRQFYEWDDNWHYKPFSNSLQRGGAKASFTRFWTSKFPSLRRWTTRSKVWFCALHCVFFFHERQIVTSPRGNRMIHSVVNLGKVSWNMRDSLLHLTTDSWLWALFGTILSVSSIWISKLSEAVLGFVQFLWTWKNFTFLNANISERLELSKLQLGGNRNFSFVQSFSPESKVCCMHVCLKCQALPQDVVRMAHCRNIFPVSTPYIYILCGGWWSNFPSKKFVFSKFMSKTSKHGH